MILADNDDLADVMDEVFSAEPLEFPGIRVVGAYFKGGRTWLKTQASGYSPASKRDAWYDHDDVRIDRIDKEIHLSARGALFSALAHLDDADLVRAREERQVRLDRELLALANLDGHSEW